MKKLSLTILTVLSCFFIFSQENELPKFGKISDEEIKMIVCPIDTGAPAFYIFDKGETDLSTLSTGFYIKFSRHVKIKILDKAASNLANFEIPLLHFGFFKEQLIVLKGYTYNYADGKIEKTKLNMKQLIKEDKFDFLIINKFAMPDVREGSVIEVYYETLIMNFTDWYFQSQIPSLYSEYTVIIPESATFNHTTYGYYPIFTKKLSSPNYRYNQYKITKYYASDIPAFKEEGFLRSPQNYLSSIKFEYVQMQIQRFSFNWNNVNKLLLESPNFGKVLSQTDFLNNEVNALKKQGLSEKELMTAAFEQIKEKMKWNDYNSLYSVGSLKQIWDKGLGNSADINLLLVAYLRLLGIEACPVALSTQDHGIIHFAHASISSLNYVVALAIIDDKKYLLDATEPYSYINLLPERCLNDKGRIIDDFRSNWIDLVVSTSDILLYANLKIDSATVFSGSIDLKESGYASIARRSTYYKNKEEVAYKEIMEKTYNGIDIQNFEIKSIEDYTKPVHTVYKITIDNTIDEVGDLLIFKSLNVFGTVENPFKLEKREYPVEFSYPVRNRTIIAYDIPGDYTVESLPHPIILVNEDNSFQYLFNISQIGNIIQVVSDLQINKTLFLPDEYEDIKELYSTIVEKQNEQIVLKKK
jgi:hypothetical protein